MRMREPVGSGEKGGLLRINSSSIFVCWLGEPNREGEMDGAEQEGTNEGTALGNSKGGWIWSIVGTLASDRRMDIYPKAASVHRF